jgi:hypothetical protein
MEPALTATAIDTCPATITTVLVEFANLFNPIDMLPP